MEPLTYEKRGYLNENFRLFHLADGKHQEIAYHYHTFHKIIILLAGRADYAIEGERYALQPGDYVLVGRGSIHKPIVERSDFYERAILYISPDYLQKLRCDDSDLETCFHKAQEDFRYVYHTGSGDRVRELFTLLEQSQQEEGFGASLLRQALFTQLMVEVNRISLAGDTVSAAAGDSKVVAILQYLNAHLTEGLQYDFHPWFFWMGVVKSLFFAFIITSVPAYYGYRVEGGSVEVGKASTDAVVASSMIVLFSDIFLTRLLS